jgi:hypothetical protein
MIGQEFIEEIPNMSNEQIEKCLALADTIRGQLRQHGKPDDLPAHLEEQELHLLAEKERRRLASIDHSASD